MITETQAYRLMRNELDKGESIIAMYEEPKAFYFAIVNSEGKSLDKNKQPLEKDADAIFDMWDRIDKGTGAYKRVDFLEHAEEVDKDFHREIDISKIK